ncbi:hypothetical protein [Geothrix fermentans]|uniref:hypothetical protein n=1 Tax=Geothrix fermentans TaxID=44676 RepID=UPI0012FA854F|nr:hypothetical protein [Geothrix fermentans]
MLRYSALSLFAVALSGAIVASQLHTPQLAILYPTLVAIGVFLLFSVALRFRVGEGLFGELGFLYVAFILAYTIFPAFTFLVIDLDLASGWVWEKLSLLLPAPSSLGAHLWRHVLFISSVAIGYLWFRGHKQIEATRPSDPNGIDFRTILILGAVVLVCISAISFMSAPVTTYIENYTRYDHLSWFPRKFVSLCARLKQGFYVALLTFLFMHYRRYKYLAWFAVLSMAAFEVIYSYGSRIESLIVLLMGFVLYHLFVNFVTLKKGVITCIALAMIFTALEVIRSYDFDLTQANGAVSAQGVSPASEFGAVYFTGFHLYEERANNAIPPTEFPMFFNDFISLLMPNDFKRWNPQYWYADAYFPDSVVPPETMGPIADSAIWGGEIDLLFRGLINGIFFAYLTRWFISRRDKWWATVIYIFCYATCIMTLKYSVFYHLNPLFKTFLPVILLIEMVRKLIRNESKFKEHNLLKYLYKRSQFSNHWSRF